MNNKIVHCPEKWMAEKVVALVGSSYSNQDSLNGVGRYGSKLCYMIEGNIVLYCSIEDEYLKNKEVILFDEWIEDYEK